MSAAEAQPGRYASVDQALFAEPGLPPGGGPSVGELLADVDVAARGLLFDVAGEDAAALLRAWPGFVASAARVWQALPDPSARAEEPDPTSQNAVHGAFHRVYARTQEIQAKLGGGGWPNGGPPDPRLVQMAAGWDRVGRLVAAYGPEVNLLDTTVRADVDAARARVMHGVYITAHAVTVALHHRGRDLVATQKQAGRPVALSQTFSPHVVPPLGKWVSRMTACETAAGQYVHQAGGPGAAFRGEAPPAPSPPDRLGHALAAWDVQAHRTLTGTPTPDDLVLVARTQQQIARTGQALVHHATPTPSTAAATREGAGRLGSALEETAQAWGEVRSRWHELTLPGGRGDLALARAAANARTACRDATPTPATGADVGRPAPGEHLAAVRDAARAGAELAPVVAEQAEAGRLSGPARALSVRAHTDAETQVETGHRAETDTAWVDPADVAANRPVPIPDPARDGLREASRTLHQRTIAAAAVAAPAPEPPPGAPQRGRPRAQDPPPRHGPGPTEGPPR